MRQRNPESPRDRCGREVGRSAQLAATYRLIDARSAASISSRLEFEDAGANRLPCGDSVLTVVEGPGGSDVDDFASVGFRFLTVQVFDADREMNVVVRRGGRIARDAVNFADIVRYGFVADPDGNWIEISARTSLTGVDVS